MDSFRLKGTDVVKEAEPGTPRHALFRHSHRYELVGDGEIEADAPEQTEQDEAPETTETEE